MNWRQLISNHSQILQANRLLLIMAAVVGIGILTRSWSDRFEWKSWFLLVIMMYSVFGLIFNFGLGLFALIKSQRQVCITYIILSIFFLVLLKSVCAVMW